MDAFRCGTGSASALSVVSLLELAQVTCSKVAVKQGAVWSLLRRRRSMAHVQAGNLVTHWRRQCHTFALPHLEKARCLSMVATSISKTIVAHCGVAPIGRPNQAVR